MAGWRVGRFSFPFARGRADDAAPRLRQLLASLLGSGAIVDINSHSLGAHVTLEALRDATANVVRYAWNFASAVDNESVEKGERYYSAAQRCPKFYVFHSKNDPVLRTWYRIGDFFDFDTALGYSGPEDPRAIMDHSRNVTVINCKDIVSSHGRTDRPARYGRSCSRSWRRPAPSSSSRSKRTTRPSARSSGRAVEPSRGPRPVRLPHAPADDVAEKAVDGLNRSVRILVNLLWP